MAMCKECRERYATDRSGRCRVCLRADDRTALVAAAVATLDVFGFTPDRPSLPPLRTIVCEGRAYDVMWDGTR